MSTANCISERAVLDTDGNRAREEVAKGKRRIQNRIAQRVYRDRMKARMSDLQARLDVHEQKGEKQQQGPTDGGRVHSETSSVPVIATSSASTYPASPFSASSPPAGDSSSLRRTSAPQISTPQSVPISQQRGRYDASADDFNASLFDCEEQDLNCPPSSDHVTEGSNLASPPVAQSSSADDRTITDGSACGHYS
ncbi:hypothetical protein MY10362_008851 [Beauveria mimosiformis]